MKDLFRFNSTYSNARSDVFISLLKYWIKNDCFINFFSLFSDLDLYFAFRRDALNQRVEKESDYFPGDIDQGRTYGQFAKIDLGVLNKIISKWRDNHKSNPQVQSLAMYLDIVYLICLQSKYMAKHILKHKRESSGVHGFYMEEDPHVVWDTTMYFEWYKGNIRVKSDRIGTAPFSVDKNTLFHYINKYYHPDYLRVHNIHPKSDSIPLSVVLSMYYKCVDNPESLGPIYSEIIELSRAYLYEYMGGLPDPQSSHLRDYSFFPVKTVYSLPWSEKWKPHHTRAAARAWVSFTDSLRKQFLVEDPNEYAPDVEYIYRDLQGKYFKWFDFDMETIIPYKISSRFRFNGLSPHNLKLNFLDKELFIRYISSINANSIE